MTNFVTAIVGQLSSALESQNATFRELIANNPNTIKLHGRPPEDFCGTKKAPHIDFWLFELEAYYATAHNYALLTDDNKIKLAVTFLSDRAQLWWKSFSRSNPSHPSLTDFQEFMKKLKETFVGISPKA